MGLVGQSVASWSGEQAQKCPSETTPKVFAGTKVAGTLLRKHEGTARQALRRFVQALLPAIA